MMRTALAAPVVALTLAACGGSGSDLVVSNPNDDDPPHPIVGDPLEEVNAALRSDAIFYLDGGHQRVSAWDCREDLSFICSANLGRLQALADPRGEFTYQVLGEWEYLYIAGVFHDGTTLFAATAGVNHSNSLPAPTPAPADAGSATWTGSMIGVQLMLGRVVYGGAEITLLDHQDPAVNVTLTPEGLAAIHWTDVPIEDGSFYEHRSEASYLRGKLYGPNAEEVGGVFEADGILGVFGAELEP